MNSTVLTYTNQLVWELRKRGVSGEVIGDAVAQIESHCADSGEDPRIVFGPADVYAASFSQEDTARNRWPRYVLHGLAGFILAALAAISLTMLLRDQSVLWGVIAVISGLALVGYASALIVRQRRCIRDPRKDLSW